MSLTRPCLGAVRARASSTWAQELAAAHPAPTSVERSGHGGNTPAYAWTQLGIDTRVAHALVCAGFSTPTDIQRLAAPLVLDSSPTLIAAETGAGKTLAYLAPIFSALRTGEDDGVPRLVRRPRALVLAPTRELVAQVRAAAVHALRGVAVVRAHTGGARRAAQQRALGEKPCDVLVSTPDALAKLRQDRAVFMSHVGYAVLDEADVLLRPGGGFDETIQALMTSLRATADREQRDIAHVYAAASVPRSLRAALAERHGGELVLAQTEALHRGPDAGRVVSRFVRVNGEEAKFKEAAHIVAKELKADAEARIMLFCDTHERRERLTDSIRTALAVPVAHVSGGRARAMEERADAWDSFRDGGEDSVRVAVCAQSYGRGIDHTGVRAVVLVDVPMTGTEYMHRVGRIRARGNVYTLVNRRERPMAAALFLASARGDRLAGLTVQAAREEYVGGVPSPLMGADKEAVARAKKSGTVLWCEPAGTATAARRRRAARR